MVLNQEVIKLIGGIFMLIIGFILLVIVVGLLGFAYCEVSASVFPRLGYKDIDISIDDVEFSRYKF